MGFSNLLMLSVGIPFIYTAAFAFLLFERVNGWIVSLRDEMLYRVGVDADKFPIVILLISIFLWWTSFYFCSLVAAWNRSKAWDNTTTRNVKEKQVGLSYRLNCAHLNEGEQFRFLLGAVIIAMVLLLSVKEDDERKYTVDWINTCCTGWVIHRLVFHMAFILNIDLLRSFNYCVAFWYSVLLLLGSLYGVITMETAMDIGTPPQFKDLHVTVMDTIHNLINQSGTQ